MECLSGLDDCMRNDVLANRFARGLRREQISICSFGPRPAIRDGFKSSSTAFPCSFPTHAFVPEARESLDGGSEEPLPNLSTRRETCLIETLNAGLGASLQGFDFDTSSLEVKIFPLQRQNFADATA